MDKLLAAERQFLRSDVPSFQPGDTVKVHVKVREGEKERTQIFQGLVIARKGGGIRETFIVRKVSQGIGVERTFPVHSPVLEKIEVERESEAMKARLYYLRGRTGKAAVAIKEKDRAAEIHAQHEAEKAARMTAATSVTVPATEPAKTA